MTASTTTGEALLALALRVESATGPDRDIDGWVHVLVYPDRQTIVGHEPGRFPRKPIFGPERAVMESIGGKEGADYLSALTYTASADAVLTLVPGWSFPRLEYGCDDDAFGWAWRCQMLNSIRIPFRGHHGSSCADRPHGMVLATLAAALRSLAASAPSAMPGAE